MFGRENPRFETQVKDILSKQGPLGSSDEKLVDNSTLSPEERVHLMVNYQNLQASLGSIGALKNRGWHTYNFFGLKGDFNIIIDNETETIDIERVIPAKKQDTFDVKYLSLSSNGNVKYYSRPADHRRLEEDGLIGNRYALNKDMTFHRAIYTVNLIGKAIDLVAPVATPTR